MADPEAGAAGPVLRIAVAASPAAGEVQEWALSLPHGATVADALRACGLDAAQPGMACGVWGRVTDANQPLRDGDRVEWYRPLLVDPKVARRERFARQGSRGTGLFAGRRPGAKSGY